MFTAKSVELSGGFTIPAPPETAFELFSPLGEKSWVPGWDPELLHPPGVSWERGLLFRTQEEPGEAIWIVTALERDRHEVEYHRVEAGRYVARVRVRCHTHAGGHGEMRFHDLPQASGPGEGRVPGLPQAAEWTEVRVTYNFVGLSESGNAEIAAMSAEAYEAKMKRWQGWIDACLASETR